MLTMQLHNTADNGCSTDKNTESKPGIFRKASYDNHSVLWLGEVGDNNGDSGSFTDLCTLQIS